MSITYDNTERYRAASNRFYRPAAFDWLPFEVRRRADGVAEPFDPAAGAVWDVSILKPAAGVTYYVSNSATNGYAMGNDSNDGLSKSAPLLTILAAHGKSDVGTVMVNPGSYGRNSWPTTITKSISIIGDGGMVIGGSWQELVAWTLETGSTYRQTRTNVSDVYDSKFTDGDGDYSRLTRRESIAEVDANPGSWYYDNNVLYVRTADSRALTADQQIRVYLKQSVIYVTSAITVYLENLELQGGNPSPVTAGTDGSVRPTIIARNCAAKYSGSSNGFSLQGSDSYLQDCTAAKNYRDGFNYHAQNGQECRAIEINCTGYGNGWAGDHINNGTTSHESAIVARIGGEHYANNGPNVADVNTTTIWNVQINAHDSVGASVQNVNFQADGESWLDECESSGSTTDIKIASADAVVRVRSLTSGGVARRTEGDELIEYTTWSPRPAAGVKTIGPARKGVIL